VASIYLGAQGTLNYRVCGSNHYHAPVQVARPLLVPSLSRLRGGSARGFDLLGRTGHLELQSVWL